MDARVFAKYLRRSGDIPRLGANFSRAVVIPAYDELAELPRTLDALETALEAAPRPVAVIAVVNHPPGADDAPSRALLEYLEARKFPNLSVLYVPDMAGGVGGARKRGMDAFLSAHDAASVDDTVIFSLDADTRVAENYFSALETAFGNHPEAGFITVNFRHEPGETPELERAIRDYEAYLRDYVAGLRRAGSPYAFMSIGSAFAVRGNAYVRAGGMKERKAGEDFHFLQQCAKCGAFFEVSEPLVFPSARRSGRNPFGTGPALEKILAGIPPRRMPDTAFELLGKVLAAVESAPPETAERLLDAVPPAAREFLREERFPEKWKSILANTPRTPEARKRAFHCWFDGLRTLRFLHRVSADARPRTP